MKSGIRRRLILLYICAAVVECLLMFTISAAVWASANSLTDSYSSNIKMEELSKVSKQVYQDLYSYMHLKSYENINNYLRDKALLKKMISDLNDKPSGDKLLLSEYTVYNFMVTFLTYSDSAVFFRRSGDNHVSMENFHKAEKAYTFLEDSILRLNQLYLFDNISRFKSIRNLAGKVSVSGIAIVMIVSLIVVVILSVFVATITQPLTEISESANQLAERNFDIPLFTYNKKDEIGNICRAFNRMIISIREYIDTIWEKAIRENELREKEMKMNELYQEAKLDALQNQINPHFLFNTINTGAQLAMMEGSDRTCEFLEKVADFYRYNIQFSGNESVLSDELNLLESYIYIMKVRFGDRFTYSTEILTSKLNVSIPGMILQPLVENCIKYGFKDMAKGGKIHLKVYEQDKKVIISVSDNGPGFPEEKRNELLKGIFDKSSEDVIDLQDKDSGTGVGLVNVIKRLKLYFKTEDVFDIQESELGGTCFLIKLNGD